MLDVLEYMVIKHVKAYNVEHVYKVSWVKITDGTFISMVEHPLKNLGEIFFHELLTNLLCPKYGFSLPKN